MGKRVFWGLIMVVAWPSISSADVGNCETLLQSIPIHAQRTQYTCGPTCARSVLEYMKNMRLSERQLGEMLGTYDIGYTPPENLEALWPKFGLRAERAFNQSIRDLRESFERGESLIVFITLEEIPHYAVVRKISANEIELMDPWVARSRAFSKMSLEVFESLWTFTLDGRTENKTVLKISRAIF